MSRKREPLPTRVTGLPPLPQAFHDRLDEGLSDLGVRLRAPQRAAIESHVRLLIAWNAAINLTAIRDPVDIALLHVVDSIAAAPLLRDAGAARFLDLGSGGGFPGLPLAVALDAEALLVDSIGKKATFLATVVDALNAKGIQAVAARAETLARDPSHRERWPAVTARAVGSLAELVELAFPLLAVGGRLVAWKRGYLRAEVGAARSIVGHAGGGDIDVVPVPVPALLEHRLVIVTKRHPTPPGWPRDPSVRHRLRP